MLKTVLKTSALGILSIALLTGCSNKDPKPKEPAVYVDPELQGAPQWVVNPFIAGKVVDIGNAKPNAGNDFSFQREEAIADARNNLARQISIKVSNMIKTFKGATNTTFDKSVETVSKQVASETLVGSKMTKMWRSRSGTMYVLVELNPKSVEKKMDETIKTSFKNDEALYQKFLMSKAQGELERELEKKVN